MNRDTPWRTARRVMNLHPSGGNDWYRIKNQADGPTQLHIYDEIGYFGIQAADLVKDLEDVKGPLEVHLNSPGGEVFDGIAIYDYLARRGNVTTIIDSLAASITSVIACAGNQVLMSKNAQMMVHDGHTMAIGNAADLNKLIAQLDRASDIIASIYADRTGKSAMYWRGLMKDETWFTAPQALDAKLIDKVLDYAGVAPVSANWDLDRVFKNGSLSNVDGAMRPPWVSEDQPMHRPMTGRHAHGHAAFGHSDHDDGMHHHVHEHSNDASHDHMHDAPSSGPSNRNPDPDHDGDDDRYPETDTDHDYWTADGRPIGLMAVHVLTPMQEAILNAWSGPAAMAKCHSASDYRSVCAGRRSGDPALEKTWALPHHDSPGAAANPDGVSAALGRLDQTEGLINKEAARKHLEAHQGAKKKGDSDNHSHTHDGLGSLTDEEVKNIVDSFKEVSF